MCVIVFVNEKRPTPEQVELMFNHNSAGAGIAWRNGKEEVCWEKGLEIEKIKACVAKAPIPFVAHFRIPTCGGRIPELCHPFTIDEQASVELKGKTKGFVLFHNGHWQDWKKESIGLARDIAKLGKKIPAGKWSDTRAMAWMAGVCGLGILEMIDEKAIAFGPDDYELYPGMGWTKMDGFYVSNDHWIAVSYNKTYNHGSFVPICWANLCKESKVIGYDYCKEHLGSDKKWNYEQEQKDKAVDKVDIRNVCASHKCINYAVKGVNLCALHLLEASNKRKDLKAGGTSDQSSFRTVHDIAEATGSRRQVDLQADGKEGQEALGEGNEEARGEVEEEFGGSTSESSFEGDCKALMVVDDSIALESLRRNQEAIDWVRARNPKDYRGQGRIIKAEDRFNRAPDNFNDTNVRVKRQEMREQGIQLVGPL